VNDRLLLETVDADLHTRSVSDRDMAARVAAIDSAKGTVRLYVATAKGWSLIGPYSVHGVSENGRFVVARNVVDDRWWLFDSWKDAPSTHR
jgi:hypothetical protein